MNFTSTHLPRTPSCDCSQPGDIWWWTSSVGNYFLSPPVVPGSWELAIYILPHNNSREPNLSEE